MFTTSTARDNDLPLECSGIYQLFVDVKIIFGNKGKVTIVFHQLMYIDIFSLSNSLDLRSDAPHSFPKSICCGTIFYTSGAPYRKEIQEYPFESGKYALTWNGESDFYQLMKTPTSGQQSYYPSPPKMVSVFTIC